MRYQESQPCLHLRKIDSSSQESSVRILTNERTKRTNDGFGNPYKDPHHASAPCRRGSPLGGRPAERGRLRSGRKPRSGRCVVVVIVVVVMPSSDRWATRSSSDTGVVVVVVRHCRPPRGVAAVGPRYQASRTNMRRRGGEASIRHRPSRPPSTTLSNPPGSASVSGPLGAF